MSPRGQKWAATVCAGDAQLVRILIGRASARYSGRIDAELTPGDVILLLRDPGRGGSGACVLFDRGAKGVQPRHWMPDGSEIISESWQRDGGGQLEIAHRSRGERLQVFFDYCEQQINAPGRMVSELIKLGGEAEFSDALAQRLELLEPGLELIGREYRTAVGPIDILARERGGRLVIIEVKRVKCTTGSLYQVLRYIDCLGEESADPPPRAILVAPHIARGAQEQIAKHQDISYVRLGFGDLPATSK